MSRTGRLDPFLAEHDIEAVWFAQQNNFAWLTGGSNVVNRDSPTGVAAVGYDGSDTTVVTNNIEAQRLRDEELHDDVALTTFDWYDSDLATAVAEQSPTPAAADFAVPGFEQIDPASLRQPLSEADIESYRDLSIDVAVAVEEVCRTLSARDTEQQVAARLSGELIENDIDAPVILVGGSDRAQRYRHYTPTDEELGDYALISVTAKRAGLHTSITRTVAFDPPDWLSARTRAAMRVETTALAATRARDGGTAAEIFDDIQNAYAEVGYPDEWKQHHQGGASGYAGREWKGTPTNTAPVRTPMVYAWNPTVQGAKSENSWLVTDDRIELLSATGEWPTQTVDAVGYDITLEHPGILSR